MPITHVGSVADGTVNRTTSATVTLNFATVRGDYFVVVATNGGANANLTLGGTVVTTGGVTMTLPVSSNGGGTTTLTGNMFTGFATGDHNGQTFVTTGATNSTALVMSCYRGVTGFFGGLAAIVGNTNELNASGENGSVNVVNVSQNGISREAYWLVVGTCCDDDVTTTGVTATSPSTVTPRAEHLSTGGVDTAAAIFSAEMTAGVTTTGAISWTNGRGAGLYLISLCTMLQPGPKPPRVQPMIHAFAH